MFRGPDQIAAIVARFETRDVSLWHACQLRDFRSYLDLGGIPSRSLLEQAGATFTHFQTDASDRSNGVWDKVFVNLSDFGASFAHGAPATPNPYGPIVFQVRPRAINRATNVAVCLRSAGSADFDRESESLGSVDDIDRLFRYPVSAPFPKNAVVRFRDQLREAFSPRYPDAVNVEVSLAIEPELVPLDEIIAVWVEPMDVRPARLLDLVVDGVSHSRWSGPIHERYMDPERLLVMGDLVRYLVDQSGPARLRLLAGRADMAAETHEWAASVLSRDLDWQFQRYAAYLRAGTLATNPQELSLGRPAFGPARQTAGAFKSSDSQRR